MLANKRISLYIVMLGMFALFTGCAKEKADGGAEKSNLTSHSYSVELNKNCRIKSEQEKNIYSLAEITNPDCVKWYVELSALSEVSQIVYEGQLLYVNVYDEKCSLVFGTCVEDTGRKWEQLFLEPEKSYLIDVGGILSRYDGWTTGTYSVELVLSFYVNDLEGDLLQTRWSVPIDICQKLSEFGTVMRQTIIFEEEYEVC